MAYIDVKTSNAFFNGITYQTALMLQSLRFVFERNAGDQGHVGQGFARRSAWDCDAGLRPSCRVYSELKQRDAFLICVSRTEDCQLTGTKLSVVWPPGITRFRDHCRPSPERTIPCHQSQPCAPSFTSALMSLDSRSTCYCISSPQSPVALTHELCLSQVFVYLARSHYTAASSVG